MNQRRAGYDDEELADTAAMSADMLRNLANRWRFRIQAGRLGRHSMTESLRLVSHLEAAARLIEDGVDEHAPPGIEQAPPATEMRAALEAQRQSEERLRLMIEAVRDYAIFMLDPGGHVMSWNVGAERLEGYRADEVVGRHFSMFYTDEDRQRAHPAEELRLARAEGRYEEEGWRVRKDGTRFWANVVITPVFDREQKHVGFTKVTRDFTERRSAADDARRSEERFRLLVESVREYAIFILDPDGRITSWNLGAERIKGYTAGQIIGAHFSVFYTEEDRRRRHPEHDLQQAMATGSFAEEGWRVRKDGTRFWASVVITALEDEHRRHVGFAKVTRDMTEQRRAEETLRQLNEDLERRTAALTAANQELETFSYSVSHDLRAPLRALDGFSRLLLDRAFEKLSAQERDYLGRIRTAAQRMSQLTDALLMLSRLTRAPVRRQPADLSSLSESIVTELREGDPERQVEVAITPGLEVMADARLVRIVFENLLRNAWKFTREEPRARIEVGAREDGGGATVFFVRDNGAGFDPALSSRLFVPFQRLHRAKDFEGSGIGLATVHRVVARHGGRIWADATPGRGATFHFTLGGRDDA
jgi:PAS domain S-box-containing protein